MSEEKLKVDKLRTLDEEVSTEVMGLRLLRYAVRYYSTDIAAAWDMEEEIQRRGLYAKYGEAMSVLLDSPFVTASFYDFLHASPELRCRAALLTVRAAHSRPEP